MGSELARLRVASLRQDATRGAGAGVSRWRLALGRRVMDAGARLMGACRPAAVTFAERSRA
jgi:hypothetical protein